MEVRAGILNRFSISPGRPGTGGWAGRGLLGALVAEPGRSVDEVDVSSPSFFPAVKSRRQMGQVPC